MRKFLIRYKEGRDIRHCIFSLVRDTIEAQTPIYRFVNVSECTILPEIFAYPNQALDWLDAQDFEWSLIEY